MGMDKAKEFVEKMFTDDAFLAEVAHHGGFKENASDEEKNELIMKASKEIGYDFTTEEYTKAMEEYFEGQGPLGAIKAFAHMNKIIKKANKGKI